MDQGGWHDLVQDTRRFHGPGCFPMPAYSEFMPPPRLGIKPYGSEEPGVFDPHDPYGWKVDEVEEQWELQPGLNHIANHFLSVMTKLGSRRPRPRHPRKQAAEKPLLDAGVGRTRRRPCA